MPHVLDQLNCVVLIYPSVVLLQDNQIREIFGFSTKKGAFIMWMTWQLVRFFMLVAPKLLSTAGFGCSIAYLVMPPLGICFLDYLLVSMSLL